MCITLVCRNMGLLPQIVSSFLFLLNESLISEFQRQITDPSKLNSTLDSLCEAFIEGYNFTIVCRVEQSTALAVSFLIFYL